MWENQNRPVRAVAKRLRRSTGADRVYSVQRAWRRLVAVRRRGRGYTVISLLPWWRLSGRVPMDGYGLYRAIPHPLSTNGALRRVSGPVVMSTMSKGSTVQRALVCLAWRADLTT